MKTDLTCIVCPNGCNLVIEQDDDGKILSVTGNRCKRGLTYAQQEMTDPRRTIATSVLVSGGSLPLCSVRVTIPIPKARIFEAVEAIHTLRVTAPVKIGDILMEDLLGISDCNVIATKNIACVTK